MYYNRVKKPQEEKSFEDINETRQFDHANINIDPVYANKLNIVNQPTTN